MFLGIILNVNVDFVQVKSVGYYRQLKQSQSKEWAGQATSQSTKMSLENRKYSASKLIFPQMKKVSENCLQFGLAPPKMFASLAIYIYLCVCVSYHHLVQNHFVFSLLSTCKTWDVQNCIWNLDSYTEGGKKDEDVRE